MSVINLLEGSTETEENFGKLVETKLPKTRKHEFVMFFLNGCGPCNDMKGTWVELANTNSKENVLVCAIESKNAQIINPNVNLFPTFCYYGPNEVVETFSNKRSKKNLQSWINGHVHSGKQGGKKTKKTKKTKKRSRRSLKKTSKGFMSFF